MPSSYSFPDPFTANIGHTSDSASLDLPAESVPSSQHGLSKRLITEGLLEPTATRQAEREAHERGVSLLEHLIQSGMVAARDATFMAAQEHGLPVVDLDTLHLDDPPPVDTMPVEILRRHNVIPLSRTEHRLTVAVPYPATLAQLDELQFATGLIVEGILVPIDQLRPALEKYLAQQFTNTENLLGSFDDHADSLGSLEFGEELTDNENTTITASSDDAPVVKFVNRLLLNAIHRGASDIHFEPYENTFRIRLRIDGILLEVARPPFAMRARLATRLKVMARLDISERRLPQDGAIKLRLSEDQTIDFRVNSLPTIYGEKIVLRILDPLSASKGIDDLGFTAEQKALYERALAQPQGMILATGPTGSGKTVTLYTGLSILNTSERNISTAEDPVEIKLPGMNQLNVLPAIGLDFANALRAFLRQDPDVVMVGEIRDLETAEIAIKASQTGHLVLSTVHTNSAAETFNRLRNMGIAPFNIASSISLVIAQRLVRKLCLQCKQPAEIPRDILLKEGIGNEALAEAKLFRAVGCRHCTLGYKGRVGIYELVPISKEISRLILQGCDSPEIATQARREGHRELRHHGLLKVLEGVTSLEEINRITTTQ